MPFQNIKHIFFDLDHTIWDFEKNSKQTLIEIIERRKLKDKYGFSGVEFYNIYKDINEYYWTLYRQNKISKEELRVNRFYDALMTFDVDNLELASEMTEEYIEHSPLKTNLFPNAISTLEYLSDKYELHIITNGFDEVQYRKLSASKLDVYFKEIITSETVGVKKPDQLIFNYSLDVAKAKAHDSLMIGDSYEADILGAINANMRAVYFNPNTDVNSFNDIKQIKDLHELTKIL